MFELSANIEYMFQEAGESLEARIAAAAAAGFRKVEMFGPENRDAASIKAALDEHDVQMWTLLNDPRTVLAQEENHQQFIDNFTQAAAFAQQLGCPHVVCGSGIGLPFIPRQVALQTVVKAVSAVANIASDYGVTVLLEAVNTRVDHPGVLFSRTEDALQVAQSVDSPQVKVLYDLYHSVAEGEDPQQVIPQVIAQTAHVQIADFPGRGAPGSGSLDWSKQLQLLADAGYRGVIGIECHPGQDSTAQALEYIQSLANQD